MFFGGTIFYYHASLVICVKPQISLNVYDTIQSTHHFECLSKDIGVKIQLYHGDNGLFTSCGFEEFIYENNKILTFCRVEAHHQNGGAEQAIRVVVFKDRVITIIAEIILPFTSLDYIWDMEIKHAIHLQNKTPMYNSSINEAGK